MDGNLSITFTSLCDMLLVKIRPLMDGNTRLIHLELEFEHIEILLEKNAKKGQNKINEILKDIINKLKNKL